MSERLTITLETGNDAVPTRESVIWHLINELGSTFGLNSGIIRDVNGNKIGEWKWEPIAEENCTCDNPKHGFNCMCDWMKANPGENSYFCATSCGIYTASKPRCNKCEHTNPKPENSEILEETFHRS